MLFYTEFCDAPRWFVKIRNCFKACANQDTDEDSRKMLTVHGNYGIYLARGRPSQQVAHVCPAWLSAAPGDTILKDG